MNTMNNNHKILTAAFSVLLLVLLSFSTVLAKQSWSQKRSGSSRLPASTKVNSMQVRQGVKINPGGPVELNPQPLPPKVLKQGVKINPGGPVELNPQPLPPKVGATSNY